jgi:uncharacterized iron-regulated membrane protein
MMRQIHRWVSFPLILFLFVVTATGVVLQVEELGGIGGQAPARPTASALPGDAELAAMVQLAAARARAAQAGFPAQTLTLDFSRGGQKARFAVSPRGGPSIEVDLKSGDTKVQAAPPTSLHGLMIQLHTGRTLGAFGLIVIALCSVVFLVLTVTGFIVYLQMWQRRRGLGAGGMFWK